ncbi:MAG: hypothetical protein ACYCU8_00070 [Ferrimicrobium acidiphilum]
MAGRIPSLNELSRTDTEVAAIRSEADPRRRSALINDFLSSREALFMRIARNNVRRYTNLSAINDVDDVAQIVRNTALAMVEGSGGYAPFSNVTFEAMLQNRSHTAVQAFARSTQVSNISGDTEVRRRQADWAAIETELAEKLQREPTDKEVETYFRELHDVKEGSLVDQELKSGTIGKLRVRLTDEQWVLDNDVSPSPENAAVDESAEIARALISMALAVSDELGAYTRAWIECVIDGDQVAKTATVAAKLKITKSQAAELDKQLNEVRRRYINMRLAS